MKEVEMNPKWVSSAKENYYFMIKKWLARRDKTDRYVAIYGKKAFDLLTTNKKAIAENTLDDKEKENYRDYSYFENILNNKDKFIIFACDGLWDVISNEVACSFIDNLIKMNYNGNMAKMLAEHAIKSGSYDNVTVSILFL